MPTNLINSVIFFKRDGFRDKPEFSPEIEYPQTWLKLVPNEWYTQIIELDADFDETMFTGTVTMTLINPNDSSQPSFYTAKPLGGNYILISLYFSKDYMNDCLRIGLNIGGNQYKSNYFTCTEENRKFTSLVTYSHQESLYGIPYTKINPIFCQIRIPAFFKRKTPTAEADTGYTPTTKPYEAVARVQRKFKQEYEIIATDNLNEALCSVFDCDFIYLNNRRIIADPYVPEPLEDDGHPFSRSTLAIQELGEVFDGIDHLDYCEDISLQNLTYNIIQGIENQDFTFNWHLNQQYIPVTGIRIYFRPSNTAEWNVLAELEATATTYTIGLEFGLYDFRFQMIGMCLYLDTEIEDLGGFNEIGYQEPAKTPYSLGFRWAYIADKDFNEVERPYSGRILITELDTANSRFKCNLSDLSPLLVRGTGNEGWHIATGSQASNFCSLLNVDTNTGWIHYGTAHLGSMGFTVGKKIEFFNPFVNYRILNNNSPTLATAPSISNIFAGYPSMLGGNTFGYFNGMAGIRKPNGTYRVYMVATSNPIYGRTYVAEDANIDGHFTLSNGGTTPFLSSADIDPTSQNMNGMRECLVYSTDKINNGYIALLSTKDNNDVQFPSFMFLDDNGDKIQGKGILRAILIDAFWTSINADSSRPPTLFSCVKYQNKYNLSVGHWGGDKLTQTKYRVILKELVQSDNDLVTALTSTNVAQYIDSYSLIHKGTNYQNPDIRRGYTQFKFFVLDEKLYAFYFMEIDLTFNYGSILDQNRMSGLIVFDEDTQEWDWSGGMQFINPIQLYNVNPYLWWCFDHSASFANIIIEDNKIYFITGLATDNPDYFPCILEMDGLSDNNTFYIPSQTITVDNRTSEVVYDVANIPLPYTIIVNTLPSRGELRYLNGGSIENVTAGQEIVPVWGVYTFMYFPEDTDEAYSTSFKLQVRNQQGQMSNEATITFNVRGI